MLGWVALCLVIPLVVLALARRFAALNALSPVVLCYGVGMVWANVPHAPLPPRDLTIAIAGGGVVLGVPLLLLSCDLAGWVRGAKTTVLATVLGFASVAVVVTASAPLFGALPEHWKVAGMLTGTYTGSAPNMAAVGVALGVQSETLVLVTAADLVVAGCYALFLLSPAVALFARWLPAHPDATEGGEPIVLRRPTKAEWATAAALGLLIAGSGGWASTMVGPGRQELAAILTVTTLAVLASFVPIVRANAASYPLGDYCLLVFCLAVGSLCNLSALWRSSGSILLWTAAVLIGSVGLHLLLCRLAGVDRDTFVITSAAAIFTPAFVGPIASNLKNRAVLLSGLSAALVGLALGNYLGLLVAYAARALPRAGGSP